MAQADRLEAEGLKRIVRHLEILVLDKIFYLVRHAESLGNIGIVAGWDPGLSPLGHAQARQCAEFMSCFDLSGAIVLSSPFERCLSTAEMIASENSLSVRIEVSLHELFAAEWFPVGQVKFRSLAEKASSHDLIEGDYPGGRWWPERNEGTGDVQVRMAIFRNRLLGAEFPFERIVCVGHWASVDALAASMVPGIVLDRVDNASVTQIFFSGGKLSTGFVNWTDWGNLPRI
ncbi:MAG: histidine phosphatase family protein [Victivallales bacterium]|nr:histidine phosphatase family protein [Victivallales bacterium]